MKQETHWSIILAGLALLAYALWISTRNIIDPTPLNDHLKAKRVTHFDFKPSEEAAA